MLVPTRNLGPSSGRALAGGWPILRRLRRAVRPLSDTGLTAFPPVRRPAPAVRRGPYHGPCSTTRPGRSLEALLVVAVLVRPITGDARQRGRAGLHAVCWPTPCSNALGGEHARLTPAARDPVRRAPPARPRENGAGVSRRGRYTQAASSRKPEERHTCALCAKKYGWIPRLADADGQSKRVGAAHRRDPKGPAILRRRGGCPAHGYTPTNSQDWPPPRFTRPCPPAAELPDNAASPRAANSRRLLAMAIANPGLEHARSRGPRRR